MLKQQTALVRELQAIEDIRQLKARYFRAVDTQNWELLLECLSQDCFVDFTGATESAESGFATHTSDEFVEIVRRRIEGATTIHHGYTSEIALISSRHAVGVWSMSDRVVAPLESATTSHEGAGHYHDEYRNIKGDWKIVKSRLVRTYMRLAGEGPCT